MQLFKFFVFFFIFVSSIDAKNFSIAIIVDGRSESSDKIVELIKKEILELTVNEFDVNFPNNLYIDGKWKLKDIKNGLTSLLENQQADLILTIGVASSYLASKKADLQKPVVAPFILDASLLNLPKDEGRSAIKNLNFIDIPSTVERDIAFFNSIFSIKRLVILINDLYIEAIPDLEKRFQKLTEQTAMDLTFIPLGQDVTKVKSLFPKDVDAVYFSPMVHLDNEKQNELINFVNEKGIPSLTLLGKNDVENGILASLRGDFFPRISRRIALNVQQILIGENAHSLIVDFNPIEKLVLNMETARKINFYPHWDIVTDAELLYADKIETGRLITIEDAIQLSLKENLDFQVSQRELNASQQDVNNARSLLLPEINLSATAVMIDKDRAEASLGSQAERTINAGAKAQQLIFSEQAWANFSIQKNIYLSKKEQFKQVKLDLIYDASAAFLNVLRAQAFVRIQQENLKRTRQNLAQAKVRELVGTSGPAEVYRWESQEATNRKSLFEADAGLNLAKIQLMRILNLPLEENFILQELDNRSNMLRRSTNLAENYISNPQLFRLFREFVTKQALINAPELKALDAAITARERALFSANSNFWAPTLAFQAEYQKRLDRSGAGTEGLDLSGLQIPLSFPQADDENWSLVLNVSFPIFQGGPKFSQKFQADEQLKQIKLERASVTQKIEQRIRSAIFQSGASYPGMEQAEIAAEAARKSFEVVQEAYSQGAVNLIDLLDAQNNYLISEQLAADAIYTFLLDLVNIERAAAERYLTCTDDTYENFVSELEKFYSENGIKLR